MPDADHDIGIGSRVRAARRRRNWSREALAFHAGISWSAISQLEAGRRRNLRPSTLAALAGALGVTVDYLVGGTAVSAEMLEHHAVLLEDDEQFAETAVPFLREAAERGEVALAVTTAAHCEQLRELLGSGAEPHVEFADQASWCDTPAGALTRLRAFVDAHIESGAVWVRVLMERVTAGRSAEENQLWARHESLLTLLFRSTPLTIVCAYDVAALDPDTLGQVLVTHAGTLEQGGDVVANPADVDPADFLLSPLADADAAPPTGINR